MLDIIQTPTIDVNITIVIFVVLFTTFKAYSRSIFSLSRFIEAINSSYSSWLKIATQTRDFSRELVAKNSQHTGKLVCRDRKKPIQYYLNCWEVLKLTKLKHKVEINLSVNVMKVEKIS